VSIFLLRGVSCAVRNSVYVAEKRGKAKPGKARALASASAHAIARTVGTRTAGNKRPRKVASAEVGEDSETRGQDSDDGADQAPSSGPSCSKADCSGTGDVHECDICRLPWHLKCGGGAPPSWPPSLQDIYVCAKCKKQLKKTEGK
jgi:hypothetical protein